MRSAMRTVAIIVTFIAALLLPGHVYGLGCKGCIYSMDQAECHGEGFIANCQAGEICYTIGTPNGYVTWCDPTCFGDDCYLG